MKNAAAMFHVPAWGRTLLTGGFNPRRTRHPVASPAGTTLKPGASTPGSAVPAGLGFLDWTFRGLKPPVNKMPSLRDWKPPWLKQRSHIVTLNLKSQFVTSSWERLIKFFRNAVLFSACPTPPNVACYNGGMCP